MFRSAEIQNLWRKCRGAQMQRGRNCWRRNRSAEEVQWGRGAEEVLKRC